jgi:hypothetical protein
LGPKGWIWWIGEHLLIADTAEAIAAAVVRLVADTRFAALRLAQQGSEQVKAHYDWGQIASDGSSLRRRQSQREGRCEHRSQFDVSVVIPNYNRADALSDTLESLARQTLPPDSFEVLVVDDGSTDGSPALAASLQT